MQPPILSPPAAQNATPRVQADVAACLSLETLSRSARGEDWVQPRLTTRTPLLRTPSRAQLQHKTTTSVELRPDKYREKRVTIPAAAVLVALALFLVTVLLLLPILAPAELSKRRERRYPVSALSGGDLCVTQRKKCVVDVSR